MKPHFLLFFVLSYTLAVGNFLATSQSVPSPGAHGTIPDNETIYKVSKQLCWGCVGESLEFLFTHNLLAHFNATITLKARNFSKNSELNKYFKYLKSCMFCWNSAESNLCNLFVVTLAIASTKLIFRGGRVRTYDKLFAWCQAYRFGLSLNQG
ncbi:hypothetical protein QQP08_025235 [Theobroma cacao]|nr:hypothetical protein QQP08_025235 [Theobroma cacao]